MIMREHFKRGQRIFNEGDQGDKAYLIEAGKVAIVKTSPQGPVIVATIGIRAIFGEMALVDGSSRMAGALAAEDTICIVITAAQLTQKLAGLHKAMRYASENMVDYVRRTLPYDARAKTGATAETEHDTKIRKRLPSSKALDAVVWEDPIVKALFQMMVEYCRRRLPPQAPAAGVPAAAAAAAAAPAAAPAAATPTSAFW